MHHNRIVKIVEIAAAEYTLITDLFLLAVKFVSRL